MLFLNWRKNQAYAIKYLKTEILLSENYLHFSSTWSSKNNRKISKSKKEAKEQVCLYWWDYTINHNENEDENEK